MSHFIQYCKICLKVTAQCRCVSKEKEVEYTVCSDCEKKEKKK